MLAAVTGFVATLPSVVELDNVGMMSGAVYEVRSVPCRGGNNWIRGLTVLTDDDDDDDDDGKVSAGFSRSQFAAVTTTQQ